MKTYKKVEIKAVNAPSGSYAAGCPTNSKPHNTCERCELAR